MSTWCWSHSVSLSSACFILGFTHFLFPWLSDLRSSCKDFPFIASRFRIVHAFAFSAQAFFFVFISGAFMHITIFNRFFFLSFFVFFRMYFHYCPVFFVPWRDSGRVGVNDEQQQQQYTIRYHSPTSWTPCFYAFR